MYSAYKLSKQGDNIQSCHTPFPILKQSIVPCLVLTVVASWPAYRFCRRQVRWSEISISLRILQFIVIYTPRDGGACWAGVYGVALSRTLLKRLSSSKSLSESLFYLCDFSLPSGDFWILLWRLLMSFTRWLVPVIFGTFRFVKGCRLQSEKLEALWQQFFISRCRVLLLSHSVVSSSSRPRGLQHARPLCPSVPPGICSNSSPSSLWCLQASHPLMSPSPPSVSLSQHQGLFQ